MPARGILLPTRPLAMPPRRSHRKSRAGCRRCKTRKIKVGGRLLRDCVDQKAHLPKCDEVHPRCGNCRKHGVSCDFESPELRDRGSLASSTPRPRTPPCPPSDMPRATPPPLPGEPPVDRLMDFRLLHHFTINTAKTLLTRSPSAGDIWQRAVPQMAAAGRSYLMDAILALAALHLRYQNPCDGDVVRASRAYAVSALADYCDTLKRGISADNAEPLFLAASLIAFQSTASRLFVDDDAGPGRYVLPMQWFHAFQGVKTVVGSSWPWIRDSHIVKAVIDSQPSLQLDLDPLGPASFFGHLLDGLDDELAREPPPLRPATRQAYSHAVSVLNWAHRNACAPASLAFPASVSRRFVELVAEQRPRALAILACFFALLKRMDDVWWLDGAARREVTGLVGLFEPRSPWLRHLAWAMRIANWDAGAIPPEAWGAECEELPPRQDGASAGTMMSHIDTLINQLSSDAQESPEETDAGDGGA